MPKTKSQELVFAWMMSLAMAFGMEHYNLGIGKGYSVKEIIQAVRGVTRSDFVVREQARRAGDPR